jgi:hypothetical protein
MSQQSTDQRKIGRKGLNLAAFLALTLIAPSPVLAQGAKAPTGDESLPPNVAPQLAELEKFSATPANAKKAEALAERLRTPLFPYPAATQRMKLALARALAHQGKMAEADRHFRDAYAPSAPDAIIRFEAMNTHSGFLADDPATLDTAIRLTQEALKAPPESVQYHQAAYRFCCLLLVSGKQAEATAAQRKLAATAKMDAALKEKVVRLGHYLRAINERETRIDPYFAPWRPIDSLGALPARRRIADLAFAMRDMPRAATLYLELGKLARAGSQPEIEAWAHMQHSRTLYLGGGKDFPRAIAELDKFRTTYAKASCAPYALLQNALLLNNIQKDKRKSRETLEAIIKNYRNSPEAEHASYYLAMLAYYNKEYGNAAALVRRHAENFPKSPKNAYLISTFIPQMEKESREAKEK